MNSKIEGETHHSVVDASTVDFSRRTIEQLRKFLLGETVIHVWGKEMDTRKWCDAANWSLAGLVRIVRRLTNGKQQCEAEERVWSDVLDIYAQTNVHDNAVPFPKDLAERVHQAITNLVTVIDELAKHRVPCDKCGGSGTVSEVDYGSCRAERENVVCPACGGRITIKEAA